MTAGVFIIASTFTGHHINCWARPAPASGEFCRWLAVYRDGR